METKSEFGLSRESQGTLGKMVVEIKNVLFSVTRQMLIDDEPSLLLSCASLLIQLFQMTYIYFNRNLYDGWKQDNVAKYIKEITGYVLLSPQYEYLGYSTMIILLYIFVGIIALEVMLYLVLSNRTEKMSKTFPMTMLKQMINLMLSILYMPIIDLFISVWTCNNGYHYQFSDIECWNGSHLVHAIVAIIFVVFFYTLSVIHSFLYYEGRFVYSNSISKQSGFDDFTLKTYILIEVLNYSFVESQYVQVILISFGNIALYIYNYHNNTYNNLIIYKFWSMIIAINNWSCLMLIFSKILEEIIFRGTIYAWLLGIPLLIIIVIQNPEERLDLLMLDTTKATGSQLLMQQHHLLRLHYWNGQLFNIILEGYLKTHIQTCTRPDCPKELLKIIQQNYLDASKRFPYDCQLKIRYGFFLLLQGSRQYSLQEFNQAYNLNPTLDQEFVLFRYKKIIEDELNDQNVEQIDTHNENMYLNVIKGFQSKIERVTLINMDFWSQLQEDFPDLGKLNQIGLNINLLMIEIEQIWNRLQKTKQNTQKVLKMYSKFMIDVVQDQDYGEMLFEKSRLMDAAFIQKGIQLANKEEIQMESLPTMIISLAPEKFGQIINLNTACHVFGYLKNELINRKINVLIPNIYQKQHDNLMKQGFDQKLMKERQIYVKNKQNYIIPAIIEMKSLQSLDQTITVISQFKLYKPYKLTCYILFDMDDIIDSISLNCISLLGLDLRLIQNKKLLVSEIFPQLIDKNEYFNKGGAPILYKLSEDIIGGFQSNDYIEDKTKLQQEFMCQITQIILNNQHLGYMMKLDLKETDSITLPLKKQKSNFQFKYSLSKLAYSGEFTNDQVSAIHDASSIHDQTVDISALSVKQQSLTQQKSSEDQRCDYGEGIKTLQLFQNRIQEIDKEEIIEEFDEEHQQSVFQNNVEQQQDMDNGINTNIFKSRRTLLEQLKNQGRISIIQKLVWFTNILYLLMIALSFFEFFYLNEQYNQIKQNIDLIEIENKMHASFQQILTNVQNLKMLNLGVWQNYTTSTYDTAQRELMITQLTLIQDLNNQILMSNLQLTDTLENMKVTDVIQMYFSTTNYQLYDFMEATQQIISKAIDVSSLTLENITQDQPSVFFVEYNLLNDYWLALGEVADQLVNGLNDRTTKQENVEIVIITLSAIILFLSLIIYAIAIILLAQLRIQILLLFLDIPEKTVKYFYGKCENYISNLQIGEEDENVSFQEDVEEQAELNKTLKSRKKKKKYVNSNQNHKDHIVLFIFAVILLQGYFIFTYFITLTKLNNINQQIPEYNVTTRCEAFYRFCDNAERQLFYNNTINLKASTDPYSVVKQDIKDMYSYDTSMQQQHALNIDVQNAIYRDAYEHIMMEDPCDVLPTLGSPDQTTCEAFARGALAQGNSIAVARYTENLRYIMTIYDKFIAGGSKANFTTIAKGDAVAKKIVNDSVENNLLNLNNFNQTKESRTYQSKYLTPSFEYLTSNMVDGFNDDLNTHVAQKLAVFIVYNVIIFILQFFLMYPFLLDLNKQITNTRLLLTMIPLRLILKIYSIRNFIKNNLQNIQY